MGVKSVGDIGWRGLLADIAGAALGVVDLATAGVGRLVTRMVSPVNQVAQGEQVQESPRQHKSGEAADL